MVTHGIITSIPVYRNITKRDGRQKAPHGLLLITTSSAFSGRHSDHGVGLLLLFAFHGVMERLILGGRFALGFARYHHSCSVFTNFTTPFSFTPYIHFSFDSRDRRWHGLFNSKFCRVIWESQVFQAVIFTC
jgi:hypothetical protein